MNSVSYKIAIDFFQRNDSNQDNVVTQDEFSGTDEAFNLMDSDLDGEVDLDDFKDAFGLNSISVSQSNIVKDMLRNSFARQIGEDDQDVDGVLTLDEYVGTEDDFNRIDTDGDGQITPDDMLQDYLEQNPDIARMITQIDTMNMLLDALGCMGSLEFNSSF